VNAAARAYLDRFFAEQGRRYGWTPGQVEEEWRAVFAAQGGRDPICGRRFDLSKIGRGGRMPSTDHNHITNEIRGLLCGGSLDAKTCNRLIGLYSADKLQRAADYMRNPPARPVLLKLRAGIELERTVGDPVAVALDALERDVKPVLGHTEAYRELFAALGAMRS
jgi:hypothetical protein